MRRLCIFIRYDASRNIHSCNTHSIHDAAAVPSPSWTLSSSSSLQNTKEDVFRAIPEWFRTCADNMYKKKHGSSFEYAFKSKANTTMLALQRIKLPHIFTIGTNRRSECKLAHVSSSDLCMCTLSMMRVRFEVSTHVSCCSYCLSAHTMLFILFKHTYDAVHTV